MPKIVIRGRSSVGANTQDVELNAREASDLLQKTNADTASMMRARQEIDDVAAGRRESLSDVSKQLLQAGLDAEK